MIPQFRVTVSTSSGAFHRRQKADEILREPVPIGPLVIQNQRQWGTRNIAGHFESDLRRKEWIIQKSRNSVLPGEFGAIFRPLASGISPFKI